MWEIYEAVGREAMVTGASDDERMAEIRKRMLATAIWQVLLFAGTAMLTLKLFLADRLQ
ncbi:hypothetical protein [Methylorubrum extorquens]